MNRATGTRGDATLSADAALVFEVSDGVVTAIAAHEKHQDVDAVRGAYEEFARHDAAAVLAKLDASVEWVEGGGGDSPSGTFVGPDALASGVFAVIGANFDEYHVDPSEYIDHGDRVVVTGRFSGRNKGGAALDTGFEHVFEMRDGKVVRFENRPADAQAWIAGWSG